MAVSTRIRMSRMVSFRLSEGEFEKFRKLCETTEAKSISDLARTAMHHWLAKGPSVWESSLQTRVRELEVRVGSLTAEVKHLRRLLNGNSEVFD